MLKRKKHTKRRKLNTGAAVARGDEDSEDDDGEGTDEEEEEEATQTERMPDVAARQKQKEITPPPINEDIQMPVDQPSTLSGPTQDGGIAPDR